MADVAETPVQPQAVSEKCETEKIATAAAAESTDENTDAEATKTEKGIIRQIEYYFGDANLGRDKFLMGLIKKDEDGWVPFSKILTFKRLAAMTTDPEVVIKALDKSDEGLLEVSEDHTKIRRHPERPIPEPNEETRKEIISRTVYLKGFHLETTMADLIEFFAPYERVSHIRMRKYHDKPTKSYKFKGSVFITFEKLDQAQEFLKQEKVIFKDRHLIVKAQEKYFADKREEQNAKNEKKKKPKVEEPKFILPKGAILFFDGTKEGTTREILRENLGEYSTNVAFIDFSKGDKEGRIRFQTENGAVQFAEQLQDNKWKIGDDFEMDVRVLIDDEEDEYLKQTVEEMKKRRSHSRNKGGFHGNRKRRGRGDDNRDNKRSKFNDDDTNGNDKTNDGDNNDTAEN